MARFQNGWVKLSRSLFHTCYDGWDMAILGWLISAANYEDGKTEISGAQGRIIIRRGQVFTTVAEMKKRLGFTRNTIEKRLKIYESECIIKREKISKKKRSKSIITILNYDKFQNTDTYQDTYQDTYRDTYQDTYRDTPIEEVKNLRTKEIKKGKKTRARVTPDVDRFLEAYFLNMEKVYGKRPLKTRTLIDLAGQIIAEVGLDRSIALAGIFCASKREYYLKRAHSLDVLLAELPTLSMFV